MQVILKSVDGISDAIEGMFISKRTWTPELGVEIRAICDSKIGHRGLSIEPLDANDEDSLKFYSWLGMMCNMTKRHITVGRYIDFSFAVIGLHRAGQDDIDSHVKRMENRMLRNSTRLAKFGNEKSDWYKDKIITTDEAMERLALTVPKTIWIEGREYVKVTNGYVLKGLETDNDVLRGLYMLSIPSNFMFKMNLTEFSHLYKERNELGTAHPEVKICAEMMLGKIETAMPMFNRNLMMAIQN